MNTSLNLLVVEDSADDSLLLVHELKSAGFEPVWRRVDTEADFLAAIQEPPDLILSDYSMPQFNGLRAAKLLQESGRDIPFILVSGTVGEELAVEAMKCGATDYLLKDRITRLGVAVRQALEQKQLRAERARAEAEVRAQLNELRRWHEVMLDREEHILVLKNEVNELLGRLNLPPRYSTPKAL